MQNDLFRTVTDAVHATNPLHLIGSLECFGHTFLFRHLTGEKLHSSFAGFVDLQKVRIQFS